MYRESEVGFSDTGRYASRSGQLFNLPMHTEKYRFPVTVHGGTITAESNREQTVFTVYSSLGKNKLLSLYGKNHGNRLGNDLAAFQSQRASM
jgi:hypothetical protein